MDQPPQAVILVLDGVGIGPAPDSDKYGDAAASTLPHVAAAVGGLSLVNLGCWGLGNLASIAGTAAAGEPAVAYGRMQERGAGKDSTTGHWELAGLILEHPFPTYPDGFPQELVREFELAIGRAVIGNMAASGTRIIQDLGEEHQRTGSPILYTSADSVFQLAAHEETVPVNQLYDWSRAARKLLTGEHAVGRVIARPFAGAAGAYYRTPGRHDFSLSPPRSTLLDATAEAGLPVTTIGKVADLFAGRRVTVSLETTSNQEGVRALLETLRVRPGGLVFATLVDFDTVFGHRNDAEGFARALAEFDAALPVLATAMRPGDLLLLTADHGNDPTTPGTDHTRELVPLFASGPGLRTGVPLGTRRTFADVGATAAEWLGLQWRGDGESFLRMITFVSS
jgi:phosphopentomutase